MQRNMIEVIMKITELYCEHMPSQLDLINNDIYCTDLPRPHFSFCVQGNEQNSVVKYYKLIVSSTKELVEDGVGDMYDSGLIYSSDTSDVEYNGKRLLPCSLYYFKFYAMAGEKAIKSSPGVFATGIGNASLLRNRFISAPDGMLVKDAEAENSGGEPAPFFRRDVDIDKDISAVYAYVTSLGVYEFYINGQKIGDDVFSPGFTDYGKTLQYRFYNVGEYFNPGKNTVGAIVGDGWYRSNLSSSAVIISVTAALSRRIYIFCILTDRLIQYRREKTGSALRASMFIQIIRTVNTVTQDCRMQRRSYRVTDLRLIMRCFAVLLS